MEQVITRVPIPLYSLSTPHDRRESVHQDPSTKSMLPKVVSVQDKIYDFGVDRSSFPSLRIAGMR